jgi:Flp pilus assembly secretin CpaC
MKAQRGCGLLPWLVAALGLLLLRPGLICAADATDHVSITLNAGETYVIDQVDPNSTPGVRVIENPHALVVHNEEAGKLVLLGTEAGKWDITVQRTTGKTVEYDVAVNQISNPNPNDISHPGKAPAAISGSGLTTGSAAPVEVKPTTTKLDSGAGPVTTAGASPAPVKQSPATVAAVEAPTAPVAAASPAAAPSPVAVSAAPAPMAAASPAAALPLPNPVAERQAQSVTTSTSDKFRTDPAIAATGRDYASVSVTGGRHYLPADTLDLMTGTSEVFDFRARIRRVSIADTTVADLQVINPYQINLIAHKPGFTTLAVWNNQGRYQERQVRVDEGGKQQVMLNCMVAELDRSRIENQGANLAMAFPNYGLSLVGLPGQVATPYSQQTSLTSQTPQGSTSGAILPPGGALIPLLLSQNLTYGLSAKNSNVNTNSFFQYLENHQLAKILAEPHLLANSGEVAKFLSGGEIPIVISQALNSTIVFKEYGTSVQFLPTVVGRNEIELLIKPEVSAPDYTKGVALFGFTVPAFVTRRAETLVRLRDNQTLIIAGLIEHNKTSTVNKVPYLGDVPYLGGLFRTTTYNNTETDLVISVTPQIVRPLPANAQIYDPYDTPDMTTAQIRTKALAQPDASRPRF